MSRKFSWLLLIPLCALLVWGAFRCDAPVREAVVSSQGKSWKKSADYRFHSAVRKYGDWPPLMGGCLAGLLVARLLKSRRWMRVIVAAMIAMPAAGLVGAPGPVTVKVYAAGCGSTSADCPSTRSIWSTRWKPVIGHDPVLVTVIT